jgi:hypothetical protein
MIIVPARLDHIDIMNQSLTHAIRCGRLPWAGLGGEISDFLQRIEYAIILSSDVPVAAPDEPKVTL